METAMLIFSIFSAIASAMSSVYSVQKAEQTNDKNIKFQEDTNQLNIDNQWKMWEATNNYNTPRAQMQRFKDAGLNPNLIYGQHNTTSPVSVGLAQSPVSLPVDYSQIFSNLPLIMQGIQGSQTIKGQNYDNVLKKYQGDILSINAEIDKALKDVKINLGNREMEMFEANLNNIVQNTATGQSAQALNDIKRLYEQLHYDYDYKNFESYGIPADLDPNTKYIVSSIANLLEKLTGINPKLFIDNLFKN